MVAWFTLLILVSVGFAFGDEVSSGSVIELPDTTGSGMALPIPEFQSDEANQPIEAPAPILKKNQLQESQTANSDEVVVTHTDERPSVDSSKDFFMPRNGLSTTTGTDVSQVPSKADSDSMFNVLSMQDESLLSPPPANALNVPKQSGQVDQTLKIQTETPVTRPYAKLQTGGPTTDSMGDQRVEWENLPLFSSQRSDAVVAPNPQGSGSNVQQGGRSVFSESRESQLPSISDPADAGSIRHGFGQFPRGMSLPGTSAVSYPTNTAVGNDVSIGEVEEVSGMITQTFSIPTTPAQQPERSFGLDLDQDQPRENEFANKLTEPGNAIGAVGSRESQESSVVLRENLDESLSAVFVDPGAERPITEAGNTASVRVSVDQPTTMDPAPKEAIEPGSYEPQRTVRSQPLMNGILLVSLVSNVYLIFWLKRLRVRFHDLVAKKRLLDQNNL